MLPYSVQYDVCKILIKLFIHLFIHTVFETTTYQQVVYAFKNAKKRGLSYLIVNGSKYKTHSFLF